MLNNTGRWLLALSLSALLLACSSKEDGANKKSAEPKAAEPAAADPHPGPVGEPPGRRTMMSKNPQGDPTGANAADDSAPATGVVAKLEKLSDKACACKNEKCADGVQNELAALMGEMKDVQANERQAIGNTMQKLQKCLADAQQ